MYENRPIRGDYFMDRLGGCTEVLLAGAGLGIAIFTATREPAARMVLASLFASEIIGAILITRSKLSLMKIALAIFIVRLVVTVGYMGVVHHDKLAEETFGFPLVVAIYCFARVRALRARP